VDEKIRNYYRQLRDIHGRQYIYDLLEQKDPTAAQKINPNDSVRVIRALEVLEQTGESITKKQIEHGFADCPYIPYKIGISINREDLKRRIMMRTEK